MPIVHSRREFVAGLSRAGATGLLDARTSLADAGPPEAEKCSRFAKSAAPGPVGPTGPAGGGATTLDGLTDVTVTAPATDQVLKYSSGQWINAAAPGGGGTLDQYTAAYYGITGTGDETTKIRTALTSGNLVHFPPGAYLFNGSAITAAELSDGAGGIKPIAISMAPGAQIVNAAPNALFNVTGVADAKAQLIYMRNVMVTCTNSDGSGIIIEANYDWFTVDIDKVVCRRNEGSAGAATVGFCIKNAFGHAGYIEGNGFGTGVRLLGWTASEIGRVRAMSSIIGIEYDDLNFVGGNNVIQHVDALNFTRKGIIFRDSYNLKIVNSLIELSPAITGRTYGIEIIGGLNIEARLTWSYMTTSQVTNSIKISHLTNGAPPNFVRIESLCASNDLAPASCQRGKLGVISLEGTFVPALRSTVYSWHITGDSGGVAPFKVFPWFDISEILRHGGEKHSHSVSAPYVWQQSLGGLIDHGGAESDLVVDPYSALKLRATLAESDGVTIVEDATSPTGWTFVGSNVNQYLYFRREVGQGFIAGEDVEISCMWRRSDAAATLYRVIHAGNAAGVIVALADSLAGAGGSSYSIMTDRVTVPTTVSGSPTTYIQAHYSMSWTGGSPIARIARVVMRPNLHSLMVGGKKWTNGAAIPTTGTWMQGDIVWKTAPTLGQPPGWVCTTGGTPGTWKAMASLAS